MDKPTVLPRSKGWKEWRAKEAKKMNAFLVFVSRCTSVFFFFGLHVAGGKLRCENSKGSACATQCNCIRGGKVLCTLAKLNSRSLSVSLSLCFCLKQLSHRITEYRIVVVMFRSEKDDEVFGFPPPSMSYPLASIHCCCFVMIFPHFDAVPIRSES